MGAVELVEERCCFRENCDGDSDFFWHMYMRHAASFVSASRGLLIQFSLNIGCSSGLIAK